MSAPVATARGTPSGIKLKDGYSTKITFSSAPSISLWEKTVTPPGVDGGDAIDQTTMHNVTWRTSAPRSLKTLTEGQMTCAYDPGVITTIVAQINVEQTITVTFPDGSTEAFYGWLRTFEPQEVSEGNQPEANCAFTPSNFDPVAHVEAGPTVVSVAGT